MRAELFAAGLVVAAAVVGVKHFESKASPREARAAAAPTIAAAQAPHSAPPRSAAQGGYDEVRLSASADHQYYVTAAVNDQPASFLVDTGAAYVALRESDARKAGIYTSWADFTQPVRTANGETKAAVVELRAVEIGRVRVEKVRAFVLADDQLTVNLLGMTFLSRLHSVETRAGEMVLRG
ncbi:MAG: TIGR02281 family clan AA aspartic protease [Parvularculaceae bacterium]|nr:TIGR02281 family clan AA aspartic protease [Parvularculaceae bacterium]